MLFVNLQHLSFLPNFASNKLRLFCKQRIFSTQIQCCLTFSWIELQMLPRCCLIDKSIITLRHVLYLLYLCPTLDLGLFMSHLFYLFFSFIFIFIRMNRIISLIQTHLLFWLFFWVCPIIFCGWIMWIIFKCPKFSLRVLLSIYLIFCQFQSGVAYVKSV